MTNYRALFEKAHQFGRDTVPDVDEQRLRMATYNVLLGLNGWDEHPDKIDSVFESLGQRYLKGGLEAIQD